MGTHAVSSSSFLSFSHLDHFCQIILSFLLLLDLFPSFASLFESPVCSCQLRLAYMPFFPSFFFPSSSLPLRKHCWKWSSLSLQLRFSFFSSFATFPLGRACMQNSHKNTQDWRTIKRTDKSGSVFESSPLLIHGSGYLLVATRCSHTVVLSLNTCLSFIGGPRAAPRSLTARDEAIRKESKGSVHSVGKRRKTEKRGWRRKTAGKVFLSLAPD